MFVSLDVRFGFLRIMLIFRGYIRLFLERGHLLMVLLLIEVIMLSLFSFLLFGLFFYIRSLYLVLVLIRFGACEAALGLALLVCLIRSHGNDFVSSITIYEC